MKIGINLILVLTQLSLFISCGSDFKGELSIHYELKEFDLPSVVWLEDADNNYLKTLMVADWLSYDGHRDSLVCPNWSQEANWGNVSKEELDAVTMATPDINKHKIVLNIKKEKLEPGLYYYLVQTHVEDEYNILYKGKINIGEKYDSTVASVNYIPKKNPDSTMADLLCNVYAVIK
ncbi:MAG: DUF2271 domain-containing protein [Bacteroidota bacterium]